MDKGLGIWGRCRDWASWAYVGWLDGCRDCIRGVNGLGAWYMGWVYGQSAGFGVGVWTGLGILGIWDGAGAYLAYVTCTRCRYASMTDRMACVT